eukprot:TRINITY_DN24699_c0_g1_i1.p2 TRINITY_DN24699_c0_g1~~TRINITY_DN24699_c0_g1_i1.p2  ORF type:complete len:215 (-),score=8.24 TRINITY_DN24699_c0_g1_i1:60-704(-)
MQSSNSLPPSWSMFKIRIAHSIACMDSMFLSIATSLDGKNACAIEKPVPARPTIWNYTVNETLWCARKLKRVINQVDTILEQAWNPKRVGLIQLATEFLAMDAYCMDFSDSACYYGFHSLPRFADAAQNASSDHERDGTLLEYRENVLNYIFSCSQNVNATSNGTRLQSYDTNYTSTKTRIISEINPLFCMRKFCLSAMYRRLPINPYLSLIHI